MSDEFFGWMVIAIWVVMTIWVCNNRRKLKKAEKLERDSQQDQEEF